MAGLKVMVWQVLPVVIPVLVCLLIAVPSAGAVNDTVLIVVEANIQRSIDFDIRGENTSLGTVVPGQKAVNRNLNITVLSNYPDWNVNVRGSDDGHMKVSDPGGTATMVHKMEMICGRSGKPVVLGDLAQVLLPGGPEVEGVPQPLTIMQKVEFADLLAGENYNINITFEASPS